MSLSREAMLEVMAYVDGELDGEALDRVESLLASDEDASRLALELRTLGDCVRVVQADRATSKKPDEIADDVMKALGANVVSLAPLAVRRRNAVMAGVISTGFAAAAVWLLFFRSAAQLPEMPVAQASATHAPFVVPPQPTQDPASVTPQPEQLATQAAGQSGVDVESVESPSHEVSVFYVPATASANPNASSVVVWIGEGEATK